MDHYDLTTRIERLAGLDPLVDAVDRAVPAPLREGRLRDVLAGTDLGHALHPPLTDVPMGMWMGATVLDVLAARRWRWPSAALTGTGLAAAAPTIASGIVEWRDTRPREKRLGLVHAAANGLATTAYLTSFVAKLAGRTRAGAVASLAGLACTGLGGYLGGHLAYARGAGVDRTAHHRARAEAFPVTIEGEPLPGVALARETEGEAFLLTGGPGARSAVVARCTRCGRTLRTVGADVATCPEDASRFATTSGRVLRGPATTPLPVLDVEEDVDGPRLRPR